MPNTYFLKQLKFIGAIVLIFISSSLFAQVPVISSFTPTSGAIGTTVTINGSNFSNNAADNVVFVGNTRATVNSATANKLNITVNAGAISSQISVTTKGLMSYSRNPFYVTFDGAGILAPTAFDKEIDAPLPSYSGTIKSKDIDGDGKSDVIFSNPKNKAISIYRNVNTTAGVLSASSLAAKVDFSIGNEAIYINVEDLNGDGKPDIIGYNSQELNLNILVNTSTPGNISYAAPITVIGSNHMQALTTTDINGDGKPDIVFINPNDKVFSVLINKSTQSTIAFASKVDFAAGGNPNTFTAADFDGDGKIDIAIGNHNVNSNAPLVSIFNNTGNSQSISFGPQIDYSVSYSDILLAGDIDGDGKPDIMFSDYSNLSVLQNTSVPGSMKFNRLDFIDPNGSRALGFLADVDGDGKPDVIETTGYITHIVKNTSKPGSFSFEPSAPFNINAPSLFADLDGDGKPDMVLASYISNPTLGIVRNKINEPAINVISPEIGLAGTPVNITGLNFGGTLAVTIGGVNAASFTVNSPTSITAVVGTGATGPIVIKAKNGVGTGTNFVYSAPPPVISSFAPLTGPVGTTVTISGKNFNTIAANNIVFFGVAKASVTSATATQLVVNVPVGANHQPITVTTNNLTAASSKIFDVTFTATGPFAPNSFDKRIDYPVPSYPSDVLVSDLDGDGKTDIIAYNGSAFSIFRNTSTVGNTSFSTNKDIMPSGTIDRAVVADINADGKPDLIYVSVNGKKIVVLKNTSTPGTFSFAAPVTIADGATPNGVTAADFDNDGKIDIAVSHGANNTFSVLRNTTSNGNITFAPAVVITSITRDFLGGVFPGDLDGDGKIDIVAISEISQNQFNLTFKNTSTIGNISFTPINAYQYGYHPTNVVIADIDGDDKPDMAVPSGYSSYIVYKNATLAGGKIDFANAVAYEAGLYPKGLSIGDLDGDGKPDIVAPDGKFPGFIGVFKNLSKAGNLQLAAKVDYTKGVSNSNIIGLVSYGGSAVADFDGDGRPDMVVTTYYGNTISVSTNTIDAPAISSFTPASATTGVTVTITGTNLTGTTKVSFGGVDASSFTIKSATSITAVVGDGASGDVAVTSPIATGKLAGFTYLPGPSLKSFTPLAAGPGKIITLIGTHFTGATAVTFGGVSAKSFTIISDEKITAEVNNTAASGKISVTVPGGTASLDGYIFTLNPIINAFSPAYGPIDTAVVITGSNFNAGVAGNTVYFGATKAVVTAATTQQLSVKVPVGATYQPISILNTASGLTGFSVNPFVGTFKTKYSIAATDFDPKVDFALSNGAKASAISDIDGDKKADVIVVNSLANTVSIFRNTAVSGSITSNSLAAKFDLATKNTPQGIVIADIDGDGKKDIAVTNLGDNSVSVFLNKSTSGNISFATPVQLASGASPYGIAADDLDGDGKVDLIASNSDANTVSVFKNLSTPGKLLFALKVDIATGANPHGVTTADINGDGLPDILTANFGDNTFSFLQNKSIAGIIIPTSFADHWDIIAGNGVESIAVGDIDQNGLPDVVVASTKGNAVSVFSNSSRDQFPNFAEPVVLRTDDGSTSVALADLDGDSKPDIIATNSASNTLSVFRNIMPLGGAPATLFAPKVTITSANNPSFVSIGDLDGDSRPDIATINTQNNTLSILRNHPIPLPAVQPPVVSSFTPGKGAVSTSVTIKGNNFNTAADANIVFMGATQAKVNTASSTQLNVTVPVSATYQPLSVLNTSNHLTGYAKSPFITTFASKNSMSETDLSAAVNFTTSASPYGVSVGDIDGDGKPDLVISNPNSHTISVFHNASVNGSITTSSFDTKVDFTINGEPQKVIVTDIDGDGKPDIIVSSSNYAKTFISILRNTSTKGIINVSSFAAGVDFTTADASNMVIADMDGDGKPDITSGNLSIMLNHCQPGGINADSFPEQALYSLGIYKRVYTFYDINNDNKPDIIYSDGNGISIILNKSVAGNLSLGSPIALNNSAGGSAIVIADIDGDSKADIITTDYEYDVVHFQRNISADNNINANSFEGHVEFSSNRAPYDAKGSSEYLQVTDIDGDGKPDLLNISSGLNVVSFFRNISTANTPSYTFLDRKVDITAGTNVSGFAAVDIDGDGKPDIVAVNRDSNTFSIFRNAPTPAAVFTPPVITSVSPASGPAGTTVTIKGKNFNSTTAGNIVSFGLTNAVVTSATAQSISVSLPISATYETPSVLNTANGLTGYAPGKFISTYPPKKNDITTQDFDLPVNVYLGMTEYLRVGDIDGDGKPDLIVHNGYQTLTVLKNQSVIGSIDRAAFGGDSPKYQFTVGTKPQTIKVADIDGDGKPDLLVSYYSFDGIGISVLLNRSTPGNISFAPKVDIDYSSTPFGPNTYVVETGDVDGDGKPDILIANSTLKGISVLPNTSTKGKVSFASRYDFEAGREASSVNLTDIDGDGKPDLVITNKSDNTVSVLHNITPTGVINSASFEKHVDYATVASPTSVITGDLNADGKPDIIVVSSSPVPAISVLQNKSTTGVINAGSMTAKVDLTSLSSATGIAIADIDGDAKPDLVTGHTVIRNLKGNGNISRSSFAAKDVPIMQINGLFKAFSVEDIDGDGKPDIAGVDDGGLLIIRNNPVAIDQPYISSFSPAYAVKGGTVTLTGTNFSNVSSVTFGGTPAASFKIISPTSITAVVAAGTTGSVAVTSPTGGALRPGFNFVPVPTISPNGTTKMLTGGSILLQANEGFGYSYQWLRDGVKINDAYSSFYIATQSGSYTVNIRVSDISQTSEATIVTEGPDLPANNFKLAITSVSCKGSTNGTINITAVQNLAYTATITGNGVSNQYPFSDAVTINNLAAGSYSVCISIANQPNYKQCFMAIVNQPQDLSVYSTINDENKTVTLAMTGGDEYHILLNGVNYSTKNSSITLALADGNNDLTVTTDKLCQGMQQRSINISGKIIPYPNPFQNTLRLNLGNTISKNVSVEIYEIANGRKVYAKQFGDQSGVISLNLTDLGSGLYGLRLNIGNSVKIYKIEKK